MSRYRLFETNKIDLGELDERCSQIYKSEIWEVNNGAKFESQAIFNLLYCINSAREKNRSIVLMMGAHPIKLGLSGYIIDLIERGYITCLATNGAGLIHDFELSAE